MKVYFDIITNHTADVIGYEEGARTAYVSKDAEPYRTATGQPFDDRDYAGTSAFPTLDPATSFPYTPVLDAGEQNLKVPAWLNDVTLYHNRGDTTFTGENSQYGDFFGLDDLFTEHPEVVDGMIDIYQTWVEDFGIDGFRIDTMKHVNDEFWQEFGPGPCSRLRRRPTASRVLHVRRGRSRRQRRAAKSFTSHYTTHDQMQAVLDFPFQDAARGFASTGQRQRRARGRSSRTTTGTPTRDSNVYQLPTFLGNHDMGRIGCFVKADNPGAGDAELARPRPARPRADVLLARQPGRLLRRRAGLHRHRRRPGRPADDVRQPGAGLPRRRPARHRRAPTRRTTSSPTHPLYQAISDAGRADRRPPGPARRRRTRCATPPTGRASSRSRGSTASEQREYVVALNNSERPQTAGDPDVRPRGAASTRCTATGRPRLRTGQRPRSSPSRVPPLSTVVYRVDGRIPRSHAAPDITPGRPRRPRSRAAGCTSRPTSAARRSTR